MKRDLLIFFPPIYRGKTLTLSVVNVLFLTVLAIIAQEIALHAAWAGEHRQHEAHEHGVAHLNVAVEGQNIVIELFSPAANIVGFEHHPQTQAQKDQVEKARQELEDGQTLFQLPAQAQCRLISSSVDTDIDGNLADGSEAQHAHEGHSDFKAHYQFFCNKPEKPAYADVMLFRTFPGIERIAVQILTDTAQTAMELTADDYRITF